MNAGVEHGVTEFTVTPFRFWQMKTLYRLIPSFSEEWSASLYDAKK